MADPKKTQPAAEPVKLEIPPQPPIMKQYAYYRKARGGGRKFVSMVAATTRQGADRALASVLATELLKKFEVEEVPIS